MPTPDISPPVHVIGGGPAGLATAAALQGRGVRTVVVERGSDVGAVWRDRYEGLRLVTTRKWSGLPGRPIPRSAGRWPAREEYVGYLEGFARHHRLDLAAGVEVSRIDPVDRTARDGPRGWRLTANGGREMTATAVVVATGFHHTPYVPDWPGRAEFTGELLHAAAYRGAEPYRDRDVLVVGAGTTGAEIAAGLAAAGASSVRLAVRGTPHVVRRSTLGWPAQASGVLSRRLPQGMVDGLARPLLGILRDPGKHGLPRPRTSVTRVVPDTGLLRAVRRGQVRPVAAVDSFDGGTVRLADGAEVSPDVVIAATGYRRGLEPLVGHLGILDGSGMPLVHGAESHPGAPGLRFTGYTDPVSGMLREIARDAPKVAAAIARELEEARPEA